MENFIQRAIKDAYLAPWRKKGVSEENLKKMFPQYFTGSVPPKPQTKLYLVSEEKTDEQENNPSR